MVSRGDALGKLTQIVAVQKGFQFRLADQDNLQKLGIGCFQVGQQADLFKHRDAKMLRLVDNQDGAPSSGVALEETPVENVQQGFDAVGGNAVGDSQLVTDGGQ